jgi:hypothetical protein
MGTPGEWSGAVRDLLAWARTRLAQPRIAALWLLVLAAMLAAGPQGPAAWTPALSAVLIAQFRLWDDLADLPHDRVHALERVLVRSRRPGAFHVVLTASLALVAVALAALDGWTRALAYAALVAAAAALYRTTDSTGPRRWLRAQLVLAKYPAFVLLLAEDPASLRAIAAALLLYAVLGVHESRSARSGATR